MSSTPSQSVSGINQAACSKSATANFFKMFGLLRGNRQRSLSFFGPTSTTVYPPQSITSSHYGTINHLDLHYQRTTHLSSTFLPPCTLRPRHMHNTLETLGSLGPTFGIPFPRLFSSCLSPARKTPTCLNFWTCQIHDLKVPLRALASETCYPPSDATIALGLLFKEGVAVHDDPCQRTFICCWEEG